MIRLVTVAASFCSTHNFWGRDAFSFAWETGMMSMLSVRTEPRSADGLTFNLPVC
jgi:hypothetical protein